MYISEYFEVNILLTVSSLFVVVVVVVFQSIMIGCGNFNSYNSPKVCYLLAYLSIIMMMMKILMVIISVMMAVIACHNKQLLFG